MRVNQKDDGELSVPSAYRGGDEGRADLGKYGPRRIAEILSEIPYHSAYAFDPGDSTGIAEAGQGVDWLYLVTSRTLPQDEFLYFLNAAQEDNPSVAFYEGFISRPAQFSRTQIAPENIGAIKLWADRHEVKLVEVQPSQTHRIKREDVKAAGWTWKTEHEFDAIRILIYGLTMLRYGPDASVKL